MREGGVTSRSFQSDFQGGVRAVPGEHAYCMKTRLWHQREGSIELVD